MVTSAELRRRDQRKIDAARMTEDAAKVRELGPGGFAGLGTASAEPLAVLLEAIAGHARRGTNPRVWEHAARVARRILVPNDEPVPAPGPLPSGYRSANFGTVRGRGRRPRVDPLRAPHDRR